MQRADSQPPGGGEHTPKVVILGAGFGGLWTARALESVPVSVILLDRNNYHTFLPLLYQVGAAELEPFAIARPVRTIVRRQNNLHFLMAEARDVDLQSKVVRTSRGVYGYDYLVIATGSVAYDFGVKGVAPHAFPLKTLEDGVALRSHVLARFEAAMHEPDGGPREGALRFVIVGGGPTGVEFAGALAELVHGPLARDYPELEAQVSIILLEARERLLDGMPERLGRYALGRLQRMGVEVRLGALVSEVSDRCVRLGDETQLRADTVAWTAGVRGGPEVARWGLPLSGSGRIEVEHTLQVKGHPEVYAVGDVAQLAHRGDEALPMLAQVAMQGGEHAADNIRRALSGSEPRPFVYRDKGVMAVIGRNSAVATLRGRSFTGYTAWLLWLLVHIVYLIGFRNRLAVLLNWSWDYLFFERVARILLPWRQGAPQWPDGEGPRSPG